MAEFNHIANCIQLLSDALAGEIGNHRSIFGTVSHDPRFEISETQSFQIGFAAFGNNAPQTLSRLFQIRNAHSQYSRLVGHALLEYSKCD